MASKLTRFYGSLMMATLAVLLAAGLTACKGKTTMTGKTNDDYSETITVDGAKTGDQISKTFTMEEGKTSVAIRSELTAGTLHLTLSTNPLDAIDATAEESPIEVLDDETETVARYDAVGSANATLSVAPGSYLLTVTGDDASPATGVVTLTPQG